MATARLHFTKKSIESIVPPINSKIPKTGSVYDVYRDKEEKGLVLLVTDSGTKAFYLYAKVDGRPERIKLGSFPSMTVSKARTAALIKRADIGKGKNPNQERRKLKREMTLGKFFEEYMSRYSRKHKKSWEYDQREIPQRMGDWFKRKLGKISRQDIQRRMEYIHDTSGAIAANHFLQRIRAMYNKAIEWGWEGVNPAIGIKQYKKVSRERFVQPEELPLFFKALMAEQNETLRDYILLSIATGARKSNVLAMQWEHINFESSEWRIPETKNGEPLTIALSQQAMDILTFRRERSNSKWVFPSELSASGHIQDPKKAWDRLRITASISIWEKNPKTVSIITKAKEMFNFTPPPLELLKTIKKLAKENNTPLPTALMDLRLHDLRRTLGSYQAIQGSNSYVIGKSLGHKSQQSTAIYARLNLDPVRQSVQDANNVIFSHAKTE